MTEMPARLTTNAETGGAIRGLQSSALTERLVTGLAVPVTNVRMMGIPARMKCMIRPPAANMSIIESPARMRE